MIRVIERDGSLEIRLRPRRVEIKPREKRNEYIQRLDKAIETLETIINSEDADEKIRIQATNALARIIIASYSMIVDIEVEKLEEEAENIERLLQERKEKRDPGYTLEGKDGQTLEWDPDKEEWAPRTEKHRK